MIGVISLNSTSFMIISLLLGTSATNVPNLHFCQKYSISSRISGSPCHGDLPGRCCACEALLKMPGTSAGGRKAPAVTELSV